MLSPTHSTDFYSVVTPIYEGPLDLLLQLIERSELDITKLSLALVTDQFLDYLRQIPKGALENVSSFLVIACRLIQIKSEALLPRPPLREPGEVDPGEALALQLISYRRFKELSNLLALRQSEGKRTYPRLAPISRIETVQDLQGLTAEDLFLAAQNIFSKEFDLPYLSMVVSTPNFTVRDKIKVITEYIKFHHHGTFDDLFISKKRRLEVVVTFIALLELIKCRMIQAYQEGIFSQIEFETSETWTEEQELNLNFIE